MLVDVVRAAAPRLHLMDAVVGMEGEGPSAGEKAQIGLILGSSCPFALDRVAAALVGVEAGEVPTIVESVRRGYIPANVEDIPLIGDPFPCPGYASACRPGLLIWTFSRQIQVASSLAGSCGRLITACGRTPHFLLKLVLVAGSVPGSVRPVPSG